METHSYIIYNRFTNGHTINFIFMFLIGVCAYIIRRYMVWEHQKRESGERDHLLCAPQDVSQDTHEMYLGWRHPHYRFVL